MKTPDPHSVSDYFRDLQDQCCSAISEEEPGKGFAEDKWKYADGGGGITRIIENGDVIEKGGVNFSYISGDRLPEAALASRKHISNKPFIATGVSLVMHPRNPFVPTTHMNVRFFVADPDSDNPHWWFGGGYDLTPYYGFEEDCVHWHSIAKSTCDRFGPDYYRKFKESCDEYFYIKHRAEHRGIGGLFF